MLPIYHHVLYILHNIIFTNICQYFWFSSEIRRVFVDSILRTGVSEDIAASVPIYTRRIGISLDSNLHPYCHEKIKSPAS